MIAIIGAVREHRVSVILTGSITLIMFLSLVFTAKERGVNLFLLILLAIAVQSLIFSEMLKERQTIFAQRRGLNYLSTLNGNNRNANGSNVTGPNGHLAAVVVYQTPGSHRPNALFMVDPEMGSELAKDPPPSYFSSNCPPPKYEDAIKLNAGDLSLPALATDSPAPDNSPVPDNSPSQSTAGTAAPSVEVASSKTPNSETFPVSDSNASASSTSSEGITSKPN